MASAGSVEVSFAAETARFTAELKKVQSSLKRIEGGFDSMERVGRVAFRIFSAGAIISFTKQAFAAADATADAAERAGIAVESFSRLQFAAGQVDVEMSSLTTGISKFQVAVSKASEGNKEAMSTFALLNLEASKLKGLRIEDQLAEIAEAFKLVQDPADRTRIAAELFGKAAGPQLVPLLAQGRDGITELTRQADRLGITMSSTTAAGIDQADAAVKRLTATLSAYTAKFAAGLSIAILGPPEALLRIDEEIARLEERRNRLLSGGIGRGSASSAGQAAAKAEAAALNQQIEILIQKQRELLGLNAQAAAVRTPFGKVAADLQLIDIEAIQSLKINVDDLGLAFHRLNQSIAEIQQARASEALQLVNDAVLENQRSIEQQITQDFQNELAQRSAAAEAHRAFELQQEQALQDAMRSMRVGTVNAAIGALQAFAGQSKKAAIALVLINKGLALQQAIQNTAVAVTKALAIDPTGGLALRAKALGAAQIALIAASGIGEIQNINRAGGAPLGSPSNPINTQSQLSDQQQFGAAPRGVTQIVFAGPVFSNRQTRDFIVDAVKEAVDEDDMIVISPESRNAKDIREAPG